MEGSRVQEDVDGDAIEHQPALSRGRQLGHVVVRGRDLVGQRTEDTLCLSRPDEDVQIDVDCRPRFPRAPQQGKGSPEGMVDARPSNRSCNSTMASRIGLIGGLSLARQIPDT